MKNISHDNGLIIFIARSFSRFLKKTNIFVMQYVDKRENNAVWRSGMNCETWSQHGWEVLEVLRIMNSLTIPWHLSKFNQLRWTFPVCSVFFYSRPSNLMAYISNLKKTLKWQVSRGVLTFLSAISPPGLGLWNAPVKPSTSILRWVPKAPPWFWPEWLRPLWSY